MKKILIIFLILLSSLYLSVDIYFQNEDIKDVLIKLGQMYNKTIIFPNDINGIVNVELYNVNLETALKIILSNFDYYYEKRIIFTL